jgi:hypothetical protein
MNGSENTTQHKGNTRGNADSSGGGTNDGEGESDIHEMTSIAVISQNPLGSGGTPTISTLPMNKSIEVGAAAGTEKKLSKLERMQGGKGEPTPVDLDFSYNRTRQSDKAGWTNFHFVMCIGIVGFFIFWVLLLCRMYLPPEYAFWDLESPFFQSS